MTEDLFSIVLTGPGLSLDFRYRTGSKDLDNKVLPDLDRMVTFLSDMRTPPGAVRLFRFADSRSAADADIELSRNRAQTVADQFKQRGIAPAVVTGFGPALCRWPATTWRKAGKRTGASRSGSSAECRFRPHRGSGACRRAAASRKPAVATRERFP